MEYAEPDHYLTPHAIPNDAQWGSQWALKMINAPSAWDVSKGSKAVTVCVIDSGVNHEVGAAVAVSRWLQAGGGPGALGRRGYMCRGRVGGPGQSHAAPGPAG